MRQIRVLWALFRMKMSRTMAFRIGFFGPLFVDGSMFALQMCMFSAIYSHVDEIAGWGKGQSLMFVGTFSLINALNMTTFFFGLNNLPQLLRTGDFDNYLTKPVSPLFRVSFENINLGSLPLVFMSVAIIAYAVSLTDIHVTLPLIAGYAGLILMMLLLWYDIMLLLRSIVFFVLSATSIDKVEDAFISMCMVVPGVAFKGIYRVIFCVLLPYGIMGTVPVQFFSGVLTPGGFFEALAITAAFTAMAVGLFKLGCKNYKSASS